MSFTQETHHHDSERAPRDPWSTEPELPPDADVVTDAFDARHALDQLHSASRAQIVELEVELDALRPLLVREPSAEAQYVSAIRRLAAAEQTALDVRAALTRLDEGSYGFCAACTEPIPAARLEIMPHTHYCVQCG